MAGAPQLFRVNDVGATADVEVCWHKWRGGQKLPWERMAQGWQT